MPRNGSGVYSKPAGTTAVPDTTIESAKYNSTIDDLVQDANTARPITAGGTGATSAASARTNLGVDPARTFVTKSAGYTAVAADKAANIRFDGAYTLSLTAAATLGSGWYCYVQADGGAVTIDPNASETINGATTITIPDGYSALVICDGTNFRSTYKAVASVDISGSAPVISVTNTSTGADHEIDYRPSNGSLVVRVDKNNEVASSAFVVQVDGTERLRAQDTGVIFVGSLTLTPSGTVGGTNSATLSATENLYINATSGVRSETVRDSTSASAANMVINTSSGQIQRSTSARKYKANIEAISKERLNLFKQLEGVTYNSLCAADPKDKVYSGVVADQAHDLGLTDLVIYGDDGEIEGFAYERCAAYFLEWQKEQDEKIAMILEGKL